MDDFMQRQNQWIALNKIKIGSVVTITRKAVSYEDGWKLMWTDAMDQTVGHTGVVKTICSDNFGILLTVDALQPEYQEAYYPCFVLAPGNKPLLRLPLHE